MVEFKSSENGATIRFVVIQSSNDETEFSVEVKSPFGTAKTNSTTYVNGSPTMLFKSMSADWKGWKKEKIWGDIESAVVLTANSDSIGHTMLTVKMTDHESRFETTLIFEAGKLESMANEIALLLP